MKEQPGKIPLDFQIISDSGGFAFPQHLEKAVPKAAQLPALHDPMSSPFWVLHVA